MSVSKTIYTFAIVSLGFSYVLTNAEITYSNYSDNVIAIPNAESINSTCDDTSKQCTVNNSECSQNICKCRSGYVADASLAKCLKVASSYNDVCEEDSQCSEYLRSGGVCKDKKCICHNGYHYLHGYCHLTKGLGESCKTNDECFVGSEYDAAVCFQGFCKCNDGFYQREYSTCRRIAKEVGDDCLLDSDCAFNKAVKCHYNKCILQNLLHNFTFSRTNEILKNEGSNSVLTIGSNCEDDLDCSEVEYCSVDKKCICKRAHFASSDSKNCIPEIGEKCSTSDEIKVSDSVCVNNRWTCGSNKASLKSNQGCRPLANYNEKCEYREECQLLGPQSDCFYGSCLCNSSAQWATKEYFCWVKKKLGDTCQQNTDCYTSSISDAATCEGTTDKKICTCPKGTRPNSAKTVCILDNAGLGDYCELNDHCKVDNSLCDETNRCTCQKTHFQINGLCLPGLNAACKTNGDCKLNHTICLNATSCQCKENAVSTGDQKCTIVSTYHEPCISHDQCLNRTYCVFNNGTKALASKSARASGVGQCECYFNYYFNKGTCVDKRWLGEPCSEDAECFGAPVRPICKNKWCSCDANSHENNNQCYANAAPSAIHVQQSSLVALIATLFVLKALR